MAPRCSARFLAVAAAVVVLSPMASAQIPETFENLQVLPKDIARPELIGIMRGFTQSLGVRCEFCHVPRETPAGGSGVGGGGGLNFVFASDERDNKKIARHMIRMVDSINTRFLASIPNRDDPPTTISCITCHRGVMKPSTTETVLLGTTTRVGVDSAIARYRVLRADMVSGKYDFREQAVSEVAQRLAGMGKHADAIKLLLMNQEFYPNSAGIDFQLAESYIANGERDAGIATLRAVLTKNPNDRRAQARLQQLGVQP